MMKAHQMSDEFIMDIHADPRGRVLLKIHEITVEIVDPLSQTDLTYIPMFEGYTAFDTGSESVRVYLVMSKGERLLLYCVEVPSVPKKFIFSRTESLMYRSSKNVFTCFRITMDHPDDIGYILSGENDSEIRSNNPTSPSLGESGEDFVRRNALWLANPVVN